MPRVFISYVRENSKDVKRLVDTLKECGVDVWFDQTHLCGGDRWADVIRQEISQGDFFLACFSAEYINSPSGFVFEELEQAIEQIRQRPYNKRWFIPVLLSPCEVPNVSIRAGLTLRAYHWVPLYEDWDNGIRRIIEVILPIPFPEMVPIPAGEFLMGSNPEKDTEASENEQPQHVLHLPDYYLAKTPVTNRQYAAFVQKTNHEPPEHWKGRTPPRNREDDPTVYVSWDDAMAYCHWLSKVTRKRYLLPSSAEWEKGARGIDGRIYPWGDQWDASRCNCATEHGDPTQSGVTSVDSYPEGASPYGLLDMAGNVFEWTRSLPSSDRQEFLYPYNPYDGRETLELEASAVSPIVRGGMFLHCPSRVRCASYDFFRTSIGGPNRGFRVAMFPS
jgi:formylglycine-generating enzyme required for sulfatase activity